MYVARSHSTSDDDPLEFLQNIPLITVLSFLLSLEKCGLVSVLVVCKMLLHLY
jgi:hypothetical protein